MKHAPRLSCLILLALGACSSNPDQPSFTKSVFDRLLPGEKAGEAKPATAPKRITRAQIKEFNLAMVRANLRSALVTSTRGLGTDLLSVEHAANDPLSKPTRAGDWPSRTERTYYVPGPGLRGTPIVVSCAVKRIKDHDIEIAETPFQTTQMTEICKSDTGASFANHHFVDRGTGQVWVTQQWVGPDMAPLGLEVLEPLG